VSQVPLFVISRQLFSLGQALLIGVHCKKRYITVSYFTV